MTMLKWITKDTNINFMKARYFTYILPLIVFFLLLQGLLDKFGIWAMLFK